MQVFPQECAGEGGQWGQEQARRRALLRSMGAVAAAGLSGWAGMARAGGDWPARPVNLVVPFPAGGGTDAIARHLAHAMSLALKRNVVVENRPGAGGQIAANALKAAAPDGHTLFFSNSHALAMIPLTRSTSTFQGLPPNARERRKSLSELRIFT